MRHKTTIYFVRHGERIHIPRSKGIGLRIPGPGLTKKGIKQAKRIAEEFSKTKENIHKIYCSKMQRAIKTAEEISKTINKKPIQYKELSEFNRFLWERKIFHKNYWKLKKHYKSSLKKFNKILKKDKGKTIIIVSHGNLIQGLVGNKLGLSFKQRRFLYHGNCNITKAVFSGNKLHKIKYVNSDKPK